MERAEIEKFIELVKDKPELYDKSHPMFRNFAEKDKVWERIAVELDETDVIALRTKWKGLKDGYTKYKKWSRTHHPMVKSYSNWCWGPYMEFLAPHIASRKRKIVDETSSSSILSTKDGFFHLDLSNDTAEEKPTIEDIDITEDEGLVEYIESEPPSPNSSQYKASLRDPMAMPNDNAHVINFVHTKRSKGVDGTDLLFMSYADTFKKLSLPTQAKLKIKMATMFAEAELQEHVLQ